jgi:hypothetical protein
VNFFAAVRGGGSLDTPIFSCSLLAGRSPNNPQSALTGRVLVKLQQIPFSHTNQGDQASLPVAREAFGFTIAAQFLNQEIWIAIGHPHPRADEQIKKAVGSMANGPPGSKPVRDKIASAPVSHSNECLPRKSCFRTPRIWDFASSGTERVAYLHLSRRAWYSAGLWVTQAALISSVYPVLTSK